MSFEIERPEVKAVEVITIDGTPYAVGNMSDEVKKLVDVFNRWNVREADKQHELNLLADEVAVLKAAKDTVSRQVLEQVRKEKEAAEAAAKEAEGKEETPPAPDSDSESSADTPTEV